MNWTESEYQAYLTRQKQSAASLPTSMSESNFQGSIRQLALANGFLYYHTHDSRQSDPGFPDVVLCRPGALIFAELKSAKGKLSHEQQVWLNMLQRSIPGVEGYLWRPGDWVAIEERMTRSMQRDVTACTDTPTIG